MGTFFVTSPSASATLRSMVSNIQVRRSSELTKIELRAVVLTSDDFATDRLEKQQRIIRSSRADVFYHSL